MKGFTFVELLVVIGITAILGVSVFVNFTTFTHDQTLTKAQDQLLVSLRLAQSNATTGTICGTQAGSVWLIVFLAAAIRLQDESAECQKLYQFEGVTISQITASSCPSPFTPLTIKYQPLTGIALFQGPQSCVSSSASVEITLKNLTNNREKKVKVSKEGTINVEK